MTKTTTQTTNPFISQINALEIEATKSNLDRFSTLEAKQLDNAQVWLTSCNSTLSLV